MQLLLTGLYYVLKSIVWVTMRIYFSRIEIDDPRGYLRSKAPLIVASNHPNTLFDPIVIVVHASVKVSFLANYGIFKNPIVGAILRTLYCIPIQRPEDIGGKMLDNDKAFAQTSKHLAHKGSIFVAPEGYSYMERHIRPLKTGTMRIAFDAESSNQFALGIQVLPVGVNYDAPNRFRSRLLIKVGEPIKIADYQAAYLESPRNTVKELTAKLSNHITELCINCADEDQDQQLQITEAAADTQAKQKPTLQQWWQRAHCFAQKLQAWQAEQNPKYDAWKNTVEQYEQWLKTQQLSKNGDFETPTIGRILWLLLLSPIAIIGALSHILVFSTARLLWQKMKLYKGYESTVNYVSALFITVPLTYFLHLYFLTPLFQLNMMEKYLYALVGLPLVGLVAHWWFSDIRRVWQGIRHQQLDASTRMAGEGWRKKLSDFFN